MSVLAKVRRFGELAERRRVQVRGTAWSCTRSAADGRWRQLQLMSRRDAQPYAVLVWVEIRRLTRWGGCGRCGRSGRGAWVTGDQQGGNQVRLDHLGRGLQGESRSCTTVRGAGGDGVGRRRRCVTAHLARRRHLGAPPPLLGPLPSLPCSAPCRRFLARPLAVASSRRMRRWLVGVFFFGVLVGGRLRWGGAGVQEGAGRAATRHGLVLPPLRRVLPCAALPARARQACAVS